MTPKKQANFKPNQPNFEAEKASFKPIFMPFSFAKVLGARREVVSGFLISIRSRFFEVQK